MLGVRAFGTDGEEALGDAFAHEFAFSQRLTCFIHVRRNLKDKLAEYNIPTCLSQKIIDEVFGKNVGNVFVEGLIDAHNYIDFQHKVEALAQSWCSCQVQSSANLEGFLEYFMANKVPVIRNTMLRSVREECGLGCQPQIFTTNASESINAVLKNKVNYKRNELPDFIGKLKEVIAEQQRGGTCSYRTRKISIQAAISFLRNTREQMVRYEHRTTQKNTSQRYTLHRS